jgi:dihydrofolate synthase/folylpolyglutamate synthase
VTLPQQPEANDVIGNTIMALGARAVNTVPYVPPVSPNSKRYLVPSAERGEPINRYPLQVMGEEILVETPLVGRHQLRNVALAIAAAVELNQQGFSGVTAKSIERGIRETKWPGRFQVVAAREGWPEIVIDVAHNPAGAWALRSALSERYEDRRLIFVFGAMRDKAISEMAEILFPLADRVIATRPENPRAASAEEIRQAGVRTGAEIETIDDVQSAVERALKISDAETILVITGSIYLVGEVMSAIGAPL